MCCSVVHMCSNVDSTCVTSALQMNPLTTFRCPLRHIRSQTLCSRRVSNCTAPPPRSKTRLRLLLKGLRHFRFPKTSRSLLTPPPKPSLKLPKASKAFLKLPLTAHCVTSATQSHPYTGSHNPPHHIRPPKPFFNCLPQLNASTPLPKDLL